jgi:hypothetical protein
MIDLLSPIDALRTSSPTSPIPSTYLLPKSITIDSTIERIALILLVVAQVMHEHAEHRSEASHEDRRRHLKDHIGAINTGTSILLKIGHVACHALPVVRAITPHVAPNFVAQLLEKVPFTPELLDGAQKILGHVEQTYENSLSASRTASESEGHMARTDYERYGEQKVKAQSQADEAVRQIQEYNRANQEAMRSVTR